MRVNELVPDDDWGGYERETRPPKPPTPFLAKVITGLLLIMLAFVGVLISMTWIPEDLSKIEGLGNPEHAPDVPGLLLESIKQNTSLSLSENDVNRFLAASLLAKQEGIFSAITRPIAVGVRFHDGFMELIIERELFRNYKQTVSLYVTLRQTEDPQTRVITTTAECRESSADGIKFGGKIGTLPVPQGFMLFVQPAFESIADSPSEIRELIHAYQRRIIMRKGEIIFTPTR